VTSLSSSTLELLVMGADCCYMCNSLFFFVNGENGLKRWINHCFSVVVQCYTNKRNSQQFYYITFFLQDSKQAKFGMRQIFIKKIHSSVATHGYFPSILINMKWYISISIYLIIKGNNKGRSVSLVRPFGPSHFCFSSAAPSYMVQILKTSPSMPLPRTSSELSTL
jgi:hypothetical protein